ncbi:MAG: division/cell wall cluster transcriptional repressor MraZ [Solirubrobacterales bacterium]|nr:division/cell wall cluster transcriptional repressor MraZ [Solirubrobacterales bacterium]
MAFRGQYEHSLDVKDRLTVPSAFRDQLAGEVVLVKGPDPCLWLMAKEDFDRIAERYIAPHSLLGADARRLRRVLNSNATEGELDSAGRIRVTRKQAETAGLDGTCAVVGAGEYVEIWNAESWQKESELLADEFGEIAESFAGGAE